MAVKIRLARHGRKARPFYHIVAADSRSPRDGRFIEKIGTYNPMTYPTTVELDFDKALTWLNNGAQPSDTVRSILQREGVLYKKHLQGGVSKGAFDQATADNKFNEWIAAKLQAERALVEKLAADKASNAKQRLVAESKIKEQKLQAILKKNQAAVEAATPASAETETATESAESAE